MRIPRFRRSPLAWIVVGAAAATGAPESSSRAGPPSPSAPFATSQPSIARLPSGTFVMTFDDESGAWDVDASGHLTPKPHPTLAGLAVSSDGATWAQLPAMPTNESCGRPTCVRALIGDPHVVAPPPPEARAFFVGLASTTSTDPEPAVADALAASFTDDGTTWAPPQVFVSLDGGIVDKISVDAQPGALAAAYVSAASGKVWIATVDGITKDHVPIAERIDEVDVAPPIRAPILRRSDTNYGYLAYLVPRDAMGSLADLVVMRTDRIKLTTFPDVTEPVKTVDHWKPRDVIFHRDAIAIDPLVPGALGRRWRDAIPIALELGDYGHHVYVAYREIVPNYGRSAIVVYECDDEPVGRCLSIEDAAGYDDGWTRHEIDDCSAHGGQYQPTLAAAVYGHEVAVSFYQRVANDSSDLRLSLVGARSHDDGGDWDKPVDLRAGVRWTPCPSARGPLFAPHQIGDHFATWIGEDASSIAVTAFVDSTTCEDHGDATYDQHVATVTW
jgi:hypothetical protein